MNTQQLTKEEQDKAREIKETKEKQILRARTKLIQSADEAKYELKEALWDAEQLAAAIAKVEELEAKAHHKKALVKTQIEKSERLSELTKEYKTALKGIDDELANKLEEFDKIQGDK